MSFLLFILLMLVVFVFTPLFSTFLRIYRQTRRYRDLFRTMNGGTRSAFAGSADRQQRTRDGWVYPTRPRKKVFGKDEGEYVDFKEVNITEATSYTEYTTAPGGSTRRYTHEQRVTDAEWEEIN